MSEQSELAQLLASLQEFKLLIMGLSIEIESWRQHTSTSGDFVLIALRDLNTTVDRAISELNKP